MRKTIVALSLFWLVLFGTAVWSMCDWYWHADPRGTSQAGITDVMP